MAINNNDIRMMMKKCKRKDEKYFNENYLKYDLEEYRCKMIVALARILNAADQEEIENGIMDAWMIAMTITSQEFDENDFEIDKNVINCYDSYYKFSEVAVMILKNRTVMLEGIMYIAERYHFSFEKIKERFQVIVNEK